MTEMTLKMPINLKIKLHVLYLTVVEVATARGRLKGALMDVLDPTADDSDASSDYAPEKRDR